MTVRDRNDVAGLDAAVDPTGQLGALFNQAHPLPPHDWAFAAVLEISDLQLRALVRGERRHFEFTVPSSSGPLRSSGVFCARCQLTWGQMSVQEREVCHGDDPE